MRTSTWFLAAACALTAPGLGVADPSSLTRVVILDTSGSMAGERIDAARQELLALGRSLPPSKQHPIIVVPFNHTVEKVHRFTTPAEYQAYLQGVKANGGTSIAAGLMQAMVEIDRLGAARHVVVMIYTDGEDDQQAAIAAQEKRLDALFASRHKKGLGQTVVFCKRWESANAMLLAAVKKYPHTRVIDLAEGKMLAVTLTPRFKMAGVRWLPGDRPLLEARVEARIDVAGDSGAAGLAAVRARCLSAGVEGDVRADLAIGKTGMLTLRLPIPAGPLPRKLDLIFALEPPGTAVADKGLAVALLALERVRVEVEAPPVPHKMDLQGELAGPARWIDPATRKAAARLNLTIEVQAPITATWARPVQFAFTARAGCRILTGDTVVVKGPGKHPHVIDVEGVIDPKTGELPLHFKLVAAKNGEQRFDPPEVEFAQTVPPPPLQDVVLRARARGIRSGRWLDLTSGLATFSAKIDVEVTGQFRTKTVFALLASPPVRKVKVTPSTISTGKQTLDVEIEAILPPAPRQTDLNLRIEPPTPRDGVRVRVEGGLRLRVRGPEPARLALAFEGKVSSMWRMRTSDRHVDALVLAVHAVVPGHEPSIATGLPVSLQLTGDLEVPRSDQRLEVGRAAWLHLKPRAYPAPWFIRDALLEVEITTTSSSPAIVGSKQKVFVRIESPLKRLVLILAFTLGVLTAIWLMMRMASRLQRVPPLEQEHTTLPGESAV